MKSVRAVAFLDAISRYQALLGASSSLVGHRTIPELFRVLADHLHSVVPFDYLALVLYDDATDDMRLVVLEPADLPAPPFTRMPVAAMGPAATVWTTQQATVIPIPADGPLPPSLDWIRKGGGQVTCWLPLTTVHRRLGVLSFGSNDATDYPPDATAFMEQVAAHVAVAVDNGINFDDARRYERELRAERDRLRTLIEINNLLVTERESTAILKAISESLRRVIEHECVSLALYDRDSGELRVPLIYDESRGVTTPDIVLPPGLSPAGIAFNSRVTTVFNRTELDAFGPAGLSALTTPHSTALCCIPLVTRRGILGTLNVAAARSGAFSEDEVDVLRQASIQIAIAVENALAYRQIADRNDHLVEEKEYLEEELRQRDDFGAIVGASAALKRVLKTARAVAPTDSTVLLLGETGTGKELVARAIHDLSGRRLRAFVRLSGAALPSGLLESELFGYEKGAFTGATTNKLGRLELADKGTLFLDEIGDLPTELQPKLLRVLQEREFERLGSTRTRRIDVRIIAATNRDLEAMVDEGSFRSDLYYRLSVFPIRLPPLRERAEDIHALAQYFLDRFARRMGKRVSIVPRHVMDGLRRWRWPGNIRELENVIERAVILSPGPELQVPLQDLQPKAERRTRSGRALTLRETERESIMRALRESGGVISGPSGAAALLGLKRTTLQSMMTKLGIKRPSF